MERHEHIDVIWSKRPAFNFLGDTVLRTCRTANDNDVINYIDNPIKMSQAPTSDKKVGLNIKNWLRVQLLRQIAGM